MAVKQTDEATSNREDVGRPGQLRGKQKAKVLVGEDTINRLIGNEEIWRRRDGTGERKEHEFRFRGVDIEMKGGNGRNNRGEVRPGSDKVIGGVNRAEE